MSSSRMPGFGAWPVRCRRCRRRCGEIGAWIRGGEEVRKAWEVRLREEREGWEVEGRKD